MLLCSVTPCVGVFLPSGFGGRVGCDGNTSDILPRVVLTATALVGGGSGDGGSRAGTGVPGASVPSAHQHCLVGGGGGGKVSLQVVEAESLRTKLPS